MLTVFFVWRALNLLVNHPVDFAAILINQGQTWIYKISHTFTASARERQSSVLVSG
jgi:hypothetical protein